MNTLSYYDFQRKTVSSLLIDISALAFVYFTPAISHLLNIPLYLADPMRLMVILALVHSNKINAFFLAISLPVFSFLISGHPVFPKMILISIEMALNVFLFFIFMKMLKSSFPAILISIVLSKGVYYLLKFFLIQMAVLKTDMIMTPLVIQVATTLLFSTYLYLFLKRSRGRSAEKSHI